jgi:hypothetical protein
MLGNLRAQLAPDRLQRRERAFLVGPHQPRIARDISRQYRRQATLDPLSAHLASRQVVPAVGYSEA